MSFIITIFVPTFSHLSFGIFSVRFFFFFKFSSMAQHQAHVKFTAVKPQLMVKAPKAVDAVKFYQTAFGAVEAGRSACCPQPTAEQNLPNILCAQLELAGCSFVVYNDDSAPYDLYLFLSFLSIFIDEYSISSTIYLNQILYYYL